MSPLSSQAVRGEIWNVRFNPSEGDEINKIRPAVIMTAKGVGRMNLEVVVPITGWKPQFSNYLWMVQILPTPSNGLSKESAADAFQVKSLSSNRLQNKIGELTPDELDEIALAIALCVGYRIRKD